MSEGVLRFLSITLFTLIVLNCGNSELRAQSLQNQAICAAQAKKTFAEDNAEWDRQDKQMNLGMETISVDYESHYNTKINRCLMLVIRTYNFGKQISTSKNLFDAIERRGYGAYLWTTREGKNTGRCRRSLAS